MPEPMAPWLHDALTDINQIPESGARDTALKQSARNLVRSAEIHGIVAAIIRRDRSGTISILWMNSPRALRASVVRPGAVRIDRMKDARTLQSVWVYKDFPESIRRGMEWLHPGRNATDERGMLEAIEIDLC